MVRQPAGATTWVIAESKVSPQMILPPNFSNFLARFFLVSKSYIPPEGTKPVKATTTEERVKAGKGV